MMNFSLSERDHLKAIKQRLIEGETQGLIHALSLSVYMCVCESMHSQIQNIQNTYIYSHIHMSMHTHTCACVARPPTCIHVYTYTIIHTPLPIDKVREISNWLPQC